MLKVGWKAIIFMIIIGAGQAYSATYLIDDFNNAAFTNNWGKYSNPAGSFLRQPSTPPAIGSYSMRVSGSASSGYWVGGTYLTLPLTLKNLSQCTSFSLYYQYNSGSGTPTLRCYVQDDAGNQKYINVSGNFSTPTLLKFKNFIVDPYGPAGMTNVNWSNIFQIKFQINLNSSTGSGNFNIDELNVLGYIAPMVVSNEMTVTIKNISDNAPVGSILWNSVPFSMTSVQANSFSIANQYIQLDYNFKRTDNAGICIWTDNTNSIIAAPHYTGLNEGMNGANPSGLVGMNQTESVPLLYSVYTNFSGSDVPPVAPVSTENTNWKFIRDLGTTGYSFDADYMDVVKGNNLYSGIPGAHHGYGSWMQLPGPAGKVYLFFCGSFFNKSAQIYRSTTLTLELFHE